MDVPTSTEATSNPRTRKRAKQACETCKQRKRKCDGQQPCGFCVRYEYECAFDPQPRKRTATGSTRPASTSEITHAAPDRPKRTSSDRRSSQEEMEATSGTVFPHVLGMKLSPRDAPGVYGVSWNLGPRFESTPSFPNITALIGNEYMDLYASVYLAHIHPIYTILNGDDLLVDIHLRWQGPDRVDSKDPVYYGVAALGSLWCNSHVQNPDEAKWVDCAKEMLEATSVMNRPSLSHLTAWVLLTLYRRTTNSPHASWMASCTAMHIAEAVGAHQDPQSGSLLYSDTRDTGSDDEIRRRLFWVTVTLNAWISNEYGRSRVSIRGVTCKLPSAPDGVGGLTVDLIHLYQISEQLDEGHANDPANLLECLNRVEVPVATPSVVQLSRINLILTIYRRLRVSLPSIPHEALTRIIWAANVGLESAVDLAKENSPWWHVANVPFQVVCTYLAIDSRESLSMVGEAMRALRTVADHFKTANIQHAVDVAESLVRLSRVNKQKDMDDLKRGLEDEDRRVNDASQSMYGTRDALAYEDTEIDWDAFLSADIPLFGSTSLIGTESP